MFRLLAFLPFLLALSLGAAAAYPEADPELISEGIVELLDTGEPIYLDIQAGDFTSSLDYLIRSKLLQKGADLREYFLSESGEGWEADSLAQPVPGFLPLAPSRLVRISMELGGTTLERKSFLSFHSQRYPLYTFQVRQIILPQNRLQRIDSLSFIDSSLASEAPPLSTIKWFEPVLAATALASIVYLLWTTE